jgi:hypothetical protein
MGPPRRGAKGGKKPVSKPTRFLEWKSKPAAVLYRKIANLRTMLETIPSRDPLMSPQEFERSLEPRRRRIVREIAMLTRIVRKKI